MRKNLCVSLSIALPEQTPKRGRERSATVALAGRSQKPSQMKEKDKQERLSGVFISTPLSSLEREA